MKKFTYTITLLVFAFFFIGCEKEAMIEQPVVQENEMIPIAKLTSQNDIQHLFLQKDMQASFKDIQEGELVFMEVVDNEKTGENAGLLYRIYYREQGVAVTTLMSSVLTLKGDIYYCAPIEANLSSTISCSTSDCLNDKGACVPIVDNGHKTCSACISPGKKCTRTISAPLPELWSKLTDAIRDAVSAY